MDMSSMVDGTDCETNSFEINTSNSETFDACSEMSQFLTTLTSQLRGLRLNHNKTNTIYDLFLDFVTHFTCLNDRVLNSENGMSASESLSCISLFVRNAISEHRTKYKRQRKCEQSEAYARPQELAVGLRWDMVRDHETLNAHPKLVQCKYSHISIIDTLHSLFSRDDFRRAYFDSCDNNMQAPGVYTNFRSGSIFNSSEFFMSNPNAIQLQLATDDFEVCNPLGSKKTLHKITAFYFTIQNLPQKHLSKLNNIYVISLCNTDDLKTLYTDTNDVLRPIVEEISYLESKGMQIGDLSIKGTLSSMAFDNLGGNTTCGFIDGFRSNAPLCRVCECPRSENKHNFVEDELMHRNKEKYAAQIEKISNSTKVDYMDTCGVKNYCVLNDLAHFHITENISLDIMHDLNEGTIPLLLKNVFNFAISEKMMKETTPVAD